MGEYRDFHNRRCFTPDSDATTLYIPASLNPTLDELLDRARDHFEDATLNLENITITAEYIHTECLGYDRYDPSDYTTYLVLERVTA